MRNFHKWGDNFPTITLRLSKEATEEREVWKVWIPLASLQFDNRPDQNVLIGFIADTAFGTPDGPLEGVTVLPISDSNLPVFNDNFDPRKIARLGVSLQITIEAGTEAFEDIPLVLYCMGVATDYPNPSLSLPAALPAHESWSIKDTQDGDIFGNWTQLESFSPVEESSSSEEPVVSNSNILSTEFYTHTVNTTITEEDRRQVMIFMADIEEDIYIQLPTPETEPYSVFILNLYEGADMYVEKFGSLATQMLYGQKTLVTITPDS